MNYKKIASHLPVLEFIYSIRPFYNVLEFGCGNYSTKYFDGICNNVTSIEMKSYEWYEKIKKEVKMADVKFMKIEEITNWINENNKYYDLIFVDGINRRECIDISFNKAPVIALHDHGLRAAKLGFFKQLKKYDNYELVMLDIAQPTTSLFISDVKLLSELKKHNKYVIPILDKWY
jgi:hypothetical protein